MKRFVYIAIALMMATTLNLNAQHATVVYNYERNNFNENQPLPAETNFVVNGGVNADVNQVEVAIYRAKDRKKKKALYTGVWKRPIGNNQDMYSLPMNYQLKANDSYDIALTYYRNLSQAEREYLKVRLFQTLDAYIMSSVEVNRSSIDLQKPYRIVMNDLNTIVEDGLQDFRTRNNYVFEGFSDVVKGKVKQIEDINLSKGKFMFSGKKKKDAKGAYAKQILADLMQLVHNETEQYLNSELMTVKDTKMVDDYPTSKNRSSLSINVGYGGVHFDGGFNDLDYGHGPFVGVSLPFGRKAFSPFWANTSLSVGVFLNNFENANGQTVTGPIVKRPTYVGLGYKAFKFVRINAGASFTEKVDNSSGLDLKDVNVRPFVGISAEINLAVSFGDK